MKIPDLSGRSEVGFNMTPMIDVVFLLIIFFLVSSHLARQEAQVALALPAAQGGREDDQQSAPRLVVNVLPDGSWKVGSYTVGEDDLIAQLRARQARLRAEGNDPGRLEVRIRSDRSVPYARVQPILTACIRGGVSQVKVAVLRPGDT